MRIVLAVFCIMLNTPGITSGCSLEDVDFLRADNEMSYEFNQAKTVATLSRPLVSGGLIALTADHRLIFQTLRPLKSTLVIDEASLRQFDKDDTLVSGFSNPAAVAYSKAFLSLLSGDMSYLSEAFGYSIDCDDHGWQLTLTPRRDELNKLLKQIVVEGENQLQTVRIFETRGDITVLTLTGPARGGIDKPELYIGD